MNTNIAQQSFEKQTGALIIRQAVGLREKSNVPSEVSHATFESLGNFCKRLKGDLFFGSFDVANVIPRQIRFFRQLLLTQPRFLPPSADGLTQKAINFARRQLHNPHETRMSKTGYQPAVGICSTFEACNSGVEYSKDIMPQGKAAPLIGNMRQCKHWALASSSSQGRHNDQQPPPPRGNKDKL